MGNLAFVQLGDILHCELQVFVGRLLELASAHAGRLLARALASHGSLLLYYFLPARVIVVFRQISEGRMRKLWIGGAQACQGRDKLCKWTNNMLHEITDT